MAQAEELADLFTFAGKFGGKGSPDVDSPIGFHQGQLAYWDNTTGENTVRVLGTTVNDLPVLSTASSYMLTEGDTVAILRFRQTYFLLGRIIPPSGELRTAFAFRWNRVDGFSLPDGFNDIVTVEFDVPLWASRATIIGATQGCINNTTGGLANLHAFVRIGGSGGGYPHAVPGDYWQGLNYNNTASIDVTPGGTIDAALRAGGAWPFHSGNTAVLTATAIFASS